MTRQRCLTVFVVAATLAAPIAAQKKDFTVEDLFAPDTSARLRAEMPTPRWLPGGQAFVLIDTDRQAKRSTWTRVEVASGKASPFYDPGSLEAALVAAGVDAKSAAKSARQSKYEVPIEGDALLLEAAGDLWVWNLARSSLTRLTRDAVKEELAAWSPDGKSVAFVRANDLYVFDLAGGERRLTHDGSPERLNGILDWVYQEEIYGRDNFRAFWWSPDSRSLAFLQLDERDVPTYTLVDDIPTHPEPETKRYPKAGDPIPGVKLGIVPAGGGAARWLDLSAYAGDEPLVVRVAWTPDASEVVYQVQDREQTWLDLLAAPRDGGKPRKLLRESTPAFTSVLDDGLVMLEDHSFLWASERSGWEHVYHYDRDGKLIRQLTSGEWEVSAIHGVAEQNGWVYFSGTERSAIGGDVYRVRLDGSGLERLTEDAGTHRAIFDDDLRYFVDTYSGLMTPPRQALVTNSGKIVRHVTADKLSAALGEYRLVQPELLQVPNRDGFAMEAMLIKPPDFDPARKYPVMVFTYGGPHAPQVNDAWGRGMILWYQLLAQRGVVVWVCDNRTASGKGAQATWPLWKEFGKTELADIEDGLAWLKKNPWVDGERIGITGWSYGGFMTLYALTHSTSFALGVAGGSVTDWRNYDAVYTERYLLTPQHNPEGYVNSSPVHRAKDLHGKLLLVHGAIDDNVHPQNTMQMAYELQKAGKPFQLMLYPTSRHGVTDQKLVWHMREMMTNFILDNLAASH